MSYRRSGIAVVLLGVVAGCETRRQTPSDTTHTAIGSSTTLQDSLKSGDITVIEAFMTPIDPGANGRALVEMRFDPSLSSSRIITIHPDREETSLRDDGTGGDR